MANRTAKYATSVHGTNPQFLIEKIVRTRIHESKYWKENCTLLNSALVLERAVDDLRCVGGVYGGNIKPTPFLCLTLKLLQIQPERDIVYLFIEQPDFKYLRALGAFYLRLVGTPMEIYTKLEPIYKDYRKLRHMDRSHNFSVLHMDEFIDQLLREVRVFDVILPRLAKRIVLEDNGDIEPYKSELEEQNLIPIQLLEEKVEKLRSSGRHYDDDDDRPSQLQSAPRHNSRRYDSRADKSEPYTSRHHSDVRTNQSHDSYTERRGDRYRSSRHRDRSPHRPDKHDRGERDIKPSSSKYVGNRSRFSREEIDNENAIRAKVGLKPLR